MMLRFLFHLCTANQILYTNTKWEGCVVPCWVWAVHTVVLWSSRSYRPVCHHTLLTTTALHYSCTAMTSSALCSHAALSDQHVLSAHHHTQSTWSPSFSALMDSSSSTQRQTSSHPYSHVHMCLFDFNVFYYYFVFSVCFFTFSIDQ